MSLIFDHWSEVIQLLAPLAALVAAGAAFWGQSQTLRRANEALRKAAEAELEMRLAAAFTATSSLEQDFEQLDRQIKNLEAEAAHLKRQIAEAKLLDTRGNVEANSGL